MTTGITAARTITVSRAASGYYTALESDPSFTGLWAALGVALMATSGGAPTWTGRTAAQVATDTAVSLDSELWEAIAAESGLTTTTEGS